MAITVIVGLGNPGQSYLGTRHNLGFSVIDGLAKSLGLTWTYEKSFKADIIKTHYRDKPLYLIKPLTYMNLSGESVAAFGRYHDFATEELCVVHDEIAFELGKAKLTITEGSGGHKGVQSLVNRVGKGFVRYRLGIGPKPDDGRALADYVLASFSPAQKAALQEAIPIFIKGLYLLLEQGTTKAMNTLNRIQLLS